MKSWPNIDATLCMYAHALCMHTFIVATQFCVHECDCSCGCMCVCVCVLYECYADAHARAHARVCVFSPTPPALNGN